MYIIELISLLHSQNGFQVVFVKNNLLIWIGNKVVLASLDLVRYDNCIKFQPNFNNLLKPKEKFLFYKIFNSLCPFIYYFTLYGYNFFIIFKMKSL